MLQVQWLVIEGSGEDGRREDEGDKGDEHGEHDEESGGT